MPDTVTLAPAAPGTAGTTAKVVGAVDNVGAEKIYGWAWHPGRPADRLRIEARLGAEVAASARADFARPDLPGAGIGDGNHAFELRLTPDCVARRAELTVVAIAGDGSEAKLPFRVRRPPAPPLDTRREVEQLAAGQRELREELRSAVAALARGPRGGDAGTAAAMQVATTQAKLEERLETLDLWLTRLDGRLAAMSEAQPAVPRRRIDPWQIVLGAVLALSCGGGLGVAVLLLRPGWIG